MLLIKGMVLAAVLAGLAAGAEADKTDLFTIRKFARPANGLRADKLTTDDLTALLAAELRQPWQIGVTQPAKCAIPLAELKVQSPDKMGRAIGEAKLDDMAKAPPIPVCAWR